jgi:lipid II:glycine glycyltransferase (peptidoglycan interpeptide bridge formation enzyme)
MVKWEIFNGDSEQWNLQIRKMAFFSIYQSFEWGEIKKEDGWSVVRITTKNRDSCAQIFYKRLPLKGIFFWCPGGILGQLKIIDMNVLKKHLQYLFYYFRISFHNYYLSIEELLKIGYKRPNFCLNSNQCMILDLSSSEEELLDQMTSNWRHNLKRFEKKEIEVLRWENPDPETLYNYYEQFEKMKGLPQQHSLNSITGVIKKFKDQLVILKAVNEKEELLALRGYLFVGKQALDWYAISTDHGRSCYASNGVFWRILQDAKKREITHYDLSGVDPINNPGVYNFKKGTGATLVQYPGEFEIASLPVISSGINILIKRKFGT